VFCEACDPGSIATGDGVDQYLRFTDYLPLSRIGTRFGLGCDSFLRCDRMSTTLWRTELLEPDRYNLGNLWRQLALPQVKSNWRLPSLQQRLVKTGGRLIKRACHFWLPLTERHLTRRVLGAVVRRIEALSLPAE
jgi:hypothetical protein